MKFKKGVSPLIATVLLIAFAVSLGAVVMNWTSGSVSASSDKGSALEIDNCENVYFSIMQKNNTKSICYNRDNQIISFDIENGPKQLNGMRFSFLDTSKYIDYEMSIAEGILSHNELIYDVVLNGELKNVKIIPYISINEQKLFCTKGGEFISFIEDCD